jgi:protein-export membrane protein SecD
MLHSRRRALAAICVAWLPMMLVALVRPAARLAAQGISQPSAEAPERAATLLFELDLDAIPQERLAGAGTGATIERTAAILRRRVQEAGAADAVVLPEGPRHIRVTLPRGAPDADRIRGLLLRPGRMTFHLEEGTGRGGTAETMLLPGAREGHRSTVRRNAEMDGSRLADARATPDGRTGEWVVHLRFDAEGTKRFAEVTRRAVGRALAVVVDGRVVVAPLILEPILRGQAVISGTFTARQADDLAILLRSGALPVPISVVEEGARRPQP